ncbi:conserved membrane protein of unknown function [Candidatus Hydrogenisulfobacillus filiaventi]|uniref:Urease accessory protein UreH-like transmembrane domain-containing protein n=1 Tax=Candidatus Hydrogenisulfobacillus filiaventi TaxID=2707344 RepID=A0A6F8ZIE3_9FIRM|nr:sulfite exporter TauE/SafE family protein [Bacillota bacterium]CAB1129712.1 conserved membrane protein of unknown function [Candidatus Hydrogenisulfobacillus filiaventi]
MNLPPELWQTSLPLALGTAFVLGLLHGITPDEHTWPITFSYAIGAYSTRRGLAAGLWFSAAFTLQRALASELAYLALAPWLRNPVVDAVVYLLVGAAMWAAGLYVRREGQVWHLHLGPSQEHRLAARAPGAFRLSPRWAVVHGFLAGWGFGAYALVIYTVLAPAMKSPWLGWLPGALFGLGTMAVQAVAGALFGYWMARRRLPEEAIRRVAQGTAGSTLYWGGLAFALAGAVSLLFPAVRGWAVVTPVAIPNLHHLGLGFALVIVTVVGVGLGSLARNLARVGRDRPEAWARGGP